MLKTNAMAVAIKMIVVLGCAVTSVVALSQEETELEEIVVVGSQIKGAQINSALPVSIISSEDIDILGLDSGEELLENMAEMGLCLLYTSPSPRDVEESRMPSSA